MSRSSVKNLFDYPQAGELLAQFLHDLPVADRANAAFSAGVRL